MQASTARVVGRVLGATCVVGLVACGATWIASVAVSGERSQVVRAVGDLRTAAQARGTLTVAERYSVDVAPFSLQELSRLSPQVFVGLAVSNVSRLANHGRSVEAVFTVEVVDVLKGDLSIGGVTEIVVPGGRYGFADGTWAQVNVIGFQRPRNGYRYVWFVRPSIEDPGRTGRAPFRPMFGPLGVYELPDQPNLIVHPSGLPTSPFAISVVSLRLNPDMFIAKIRELCSH